MPHDITKWIRYHNDYYCGSNVAIFFGDTWIDDMVSFQYSAAQQKVPLWGYASQQFDAVAEGKFMLQGQFTIAFKEVGYLNVIMRKLLSRELSGKTYKEIRDAIKKKQWYRLGLGGVENKGGDFGEYYNQSPMLGWTYKDLGNGQLIRQPRISRSNIEDQLSELGMSDAKGFESLAEDLEDSIWGVNTNKPNWGTRKVTRPDNFDVVTRNNKGTDASILSGTEYQDRFVNPKSFNILITYGNINVSASEHTVQSINDVHITDVSQVLGPTGEPVMEQYSFFARGINEAIGTFKINNADTNSEQPELKNDKKEQTERYHVNIVNVRMYADASFFSNAAQLEPDRTKYAVLHGIKAYITDINTVMGKKEIAIDGIPIEGGKINYKDVIPDPHHIHPYFRIRNEVIRIFQDYRGCFSNDPFGKVSIEVTNDSGRKRYLNYLFKVGNTFATLISDTTKKVDNEFIDFNPSYNIA